MKLALDTNAYADWKRGLLWSDLITRAEEVHISAVVVGELRYGFASGKRQAKNELELSAFLNNRLVVLDSITTETTHYYATLKNFLRQQGTPLPENDVWIAAACLEVGATLLTSDKHFERLPQVRVAQLD